MIITQLSNIHNSISNIILFIIIWKCALSLIIIIYRRFANIFFVLVVFCGKFFADIVLCCPHPYFPFSSTVIYFFQKLHHFKLVSCFYSKMDIDLHDSFGGLQGTAVVGDLLRESLHD